MKNKLLILLAIFILVFNLNITSINAQDVGDALNGLNKSASQVKAFKSQTQNSNYTTFIQTKTGQMIGLVLSFVGVLFLILMIYAGISWMLANGSPEKVSKAKTLIIDAIIGLIIVFAAYAITSFIGSEVLTK